MNIIILAAGIGSRLKPITDTMPKCCVPVNGISLIRRLLLQLGSNPQINKIYIVGGYLINQLVNEVGDKPANVEILNNSEYENTNNMYSAYLALNQIRDTGPVVIINADCIYEDSIIDTLVKLNKSVIFTDSSVFNIENMKVELDENETVRKITKQLEQGPNVQVSIDLYYLSSAHIEVLSGIIAETIEVKFNKNDWTEVALDKLVKLAEIELGTIDIAGHKWFEIDTLEDLKSAERLFS